MEDKDDLSALEVRVLINRLRASPHGSEGMLYGIRIARSIKSPIMISRRVIRIRLTIMKNLVKKRKNRVINSVLFYHWRSRRDLDPRRVTTWALSKLIILIIATLTTFIKCARNSRMPANVNGAEHYYMVRVREAKSSNLFTPTGVYMASHVDSNSLRIRELEITVHMALIREILSSVVHPGS